MKNEREPYIPITEDQADNSYLDEFEAEMAGRQAAPQAPQENRARPPKKSTPVYKQWWFWLIIVLVIVAIIVAVAVGAKKKKQSATTSTSASTTVSTSVSEKSTTEQESTSASTTAQSTTAKTTAAPATESEDDKASRYQYALKKAYFMCDNELLSKQALYNELINSGVNKDAAEYAVAHVGADFRAIAREKAKEYAAQGNEEEDIQNMLINNDLFTEDEAQYAVDHLA